MVKMPKVTMDLVSDLQGYFYPIPTGRKSILIFDCAG